MKKNPKLKTKLYDTAPQRETAVLVTVTPPKQSPFKTKEYLDELAFLADTLGIESVQTFSQNLERPERATYVGTGKLAEIKAYIFTEGIDMVIFDDNLSPSQFRNLETEFGVKVYDRSLLILDIFVKRAQTAQAKIQVELARNQYLLPRLTNLWTHLERQRGGTGTRGGSGEKELETDKRTIKHHIVVLKEKLKKIDLQGLTQRKARAELVRVSLVGYTNVGKSTLMTLLSKAEVFAENKLFATVDSTVRKVVFNQIPFLLSDTVGFIRKLPHQLVESFKSTLDEVREADILIHVVDVSHPAFEEQIEVVNTTLADIKAINKKIILVFNKVDLYKQANEDGNSKLEALKQTYFGKTELYKTVFISATKKDNFDELREILQEAVADVHHVMYPNYLESPIDYNMMAKEFDEKYGLNQIFEDID